MAKKQKLHDYLICYEAYKSKFNKLIVSTSKKEAYKWFKEEYLPALFLLASDRANVVVINIIELL